MAHVIPGTFSVTEATACVEGRTLVEPGVFRGAGVADSPQPAAAAATSATAALLVNKRMGRTPDKG